LPPERDKLSATPAPNHFPIEHDPEYLRSQAERLIAALSADDVMSEATAADLDLVVDGYAHVLALDVDRLRLRREITRLAESGDPAAAAQLQELSAMLRWMTRTCQQLREVLSAVRARAELSS
jgi:hypothetical protein